MYIRKDSQFPTKKECTVKTNKKTYVFCISASISRFKKMEK